MSRKKTQISELDHSTIGGRVAYIRISNGLTQEEFAEKLGSSKGNISSWESGAYSPSFDKLVLISELFPVKSDWLLRGIGEIIEEGGPSKTDERLDRLEKQVAELSATIQRQSSATADRRQIIGIGPGGIERRSGEDRRREKNNHQPRSET